MLRGWSRQSRRRHPDRLLNRELSTLEYNARLLDLTADESLPLLERVKMCRFFSSNLDEFFMVRVAGLTEQAAAGIVVRSSDGLTPRAALALIRERALELTARQSKLWKKELCPALAAEGILISTPAELDEDELRALGDGFQREIFPVLTPLGGQSRTALPVHLRADAQPRRARARSGDRRGALRPRQGARRPPALLLRRRRQAADARERDRALPRPALPRHGDRRALGLPRHPRRRLRGLGRRRRPARGGRAGAAAPPLRRRRPARGLDLDLAGDAGAAAAGTRRRRRPGLRDPRSARPGRPRPAARPRPAGARVSALARRDAGQARPREGAARPLRRDPPRRLPRPPALRVVRGQLRGLRPRRRARPGRDRDEDRRLPDERRQPTRAGADLSSPRTASRASASSS